MKKQICARFEIIDSSKCTDFIKKNGSSNQRDSGGGWNNFFIFNFLIIYCYYFKFFNILNILNFILLFKKLFLKINFQGRIVPWPNPKNYFYGRTHYSLLKIVFQLQTSKNKFLGVLQMFLCNSEFFTKACTSFHGEVRDRNEG